MPAETLAPVQVKRRKLFKAVVRRIPAFMNAPMFASGFASKVDVPFRTYQFIPAR